MRREFLVERQGKQFVLYAGLLALGHEQGLKSIKTQLIQIPTEANNRVAIVSATVVLEKDGKEQEFQGIGDAAPNNVASAMVNALIRLAETRAKARALRDAVNVGVAALEELGDEESYESAPERGYATYGRSGGRGGVAPRRAENRQAQNWRQSQEAVRAPAATAQPTTSAPQGEARITDSQISAIRNICRQKKLEADGWVKSRCGKSLDQLSFEEAVSVIKLLQEK